MKTKLKLWWWKRQLKNRYMDYLGAADQYDSGAYLTDFISPRIWGMKQRVNEAIRKVNQLDPKANLKELPTRK